MSGGTWEYVQYRLDDVMDTIRRDIADFGKVYDKGVGDPYMEGCFKSNLEDNQEALELAKTALEAIAVAQVYIQRYDWLAAGDDGCKSFLSRTKNDLAEIEAEKRDGTLYKPRYGECD